MKGQMGPDPLMCQGVLTSPHALLQQHIAMKSPGIVTRELT